MTFVKRWIRKNKQDLSHNLEAARFFPHSSRTKSCLSWITAVALCLPVELIRMKRLYLFLTGLMQNVLALLIWVYLTPRITALLFSYPFLYKVTWDILWYACNPQGRRPSTPSTMRAGRWRSLLKRLHRRIFMEIKPLLNPRRSQFGIRGASNPVWIVLSRWWFGCHVICWRRSAALLSTPMSTQPAAERFQSTSHFHLLISLWRC